MVNFWLSSYFFWLFSHCFGFFSLVIYLKLLHCFYEKQNIYLTLNKVNRSKSSDLIKLSNKVNIPYHISLRGLKRLWYFFHHRYFITLTRPFLRLWLKLPSKLESLLKAVTVIEVNLKTFPQRWLNAIQHHSRSPQNAPEKISPNWTVFSNSLNTTTSVQT